MKKFLYCLGLALALASCATSNEKLALEKVEEAPIETTQSETLHQEFIEAFKTSATETCIKNGNNIDDCNCYTNEILNTFTLDDFAIVFNLVSSENGNIVSDQTVGPKIIDASMKCFYKN